MQIKCLPCTEQEKQFWLPFGGRPTRFRDAWFDPVLPSMRPLTRMAIINADRCPKDHFMVRQLVLLFCMRLMSTSITSYIGRLAPSPSGHLHVGHAQTFLIASERAKRRKGKLIMRMEDIDIARCKPQYSADVVEDLRWFGIDWTDGYATDSPDQNLYIQSKRFAYYEMAWKILYNKGYIYPCKLSRKDVETALSAPHDSLPHQASTINQDGEIIFPPQLRPEFMAGIKYGCGDNNHFPPTFQDLSNPSELRVNWRFRVPDVEDMDNRVMFTDSCRGKQSFEAGKDFGDFLVWRLDGYPSYELAVVVDDLLMHISEVVRGEDLTLSTARQLLLIKAIFGLDYHQESAWCPVSSSPDEAIEAPPIPPVVSVEDSFSPSAMQLYRIPRYFHSPLVCDENGVRLAKRNFARSLRTLRSEGQTPEEIRRTFLNNISQELFDR